MTPQYDTVIDMYDCDAYVPKAALVVFENQNDKFIELRPIRKDGSMGAAKGISNEFVQNLLASFSKEYRSIPHGTIPENLLYCDTRQGQETYVWYNPPMKRNRFFDSRLGLEDGIYHVPGTIYAVRDKTLSVFCFAGKKAKMDSQLLGVPYFHVYQDGHVCMGSAKAEIPETDKLSYQDVLLAWERAFWNSVDSHTNGSPSTRGNLIETIKKYKDTPFNTKELKERTTGSCTVEQLIRTLSR